MMLDIQRHLRRRRHGRLERISPRNGALNHDRAFIASSSKRFARRIEYHPDFYRPRLLLDDLCNRMFPSITGASSIDPSLRRRTGLFDFCLLADVYGSRSSRSPTGALYRSIFHYDVVWLLSCRMHDRVSSSSPLPNRVDIRTIVPLATLVIETLGLICNRSRSIMTNSPHHAPQTCCSHSPSHRSTPANSRREL